MLILSGCYDSKEIDDFAYVSAIGLDKGVTNELKMTLQIIIPKLQGGENGQGGGSSGENQTTTTVETPTIYSGLNMINNYVSKELNLSHAKMLVISEELAREGTIKYVHAMMRGREFRGNMYIVVSKTSAEEYIQNNKAVLEANPSKHHEIQLKSYEYTAFTANTTLIDFYLRQECSCVQAVATLVDVSRFESSKDFNVENSTYKHKERDVPLEGDFTAGNIPQTGESKTEMMGLAVFDGDKMVGELDGEDTGFFLMLIGDFKRAYYTIQDPLEKDYFVVLRVSESRDPSINTYLKGDKPFSNIRINLECDILSIQSGRNYESTKNLHILEAAAEEFFVKGINRFLNETTKQLNADVCGVGRSLKSKYLTWEEWTSVDWLKKYKDTSFKVDVDVKIRRTGLMIRTLPAFSAEGEEIN